MSCVLSFVVGLVTEIPEAFFNLTRPFRFARAIARSHRMHADGYHLSAMLQCLRAAEIGMAVLRSATAFRSNFGERLGVSAAIAEWETRTAGAWNLAEHCRAHLVAGLSDGSDMTPPSP